MFERTGPLRTTQTVSMLEVKILRFGAAGDHFWVISFYRIHVLQEEVQQTVDSFLHASLYERGKQILLKLGAVMLWIVSGSVSYKSWYYLTPTGCLFQAAKFGTTNQ